MTIDNSGRWWPRLIPLLAATLAVGADAWVVAGFLTPLARDLNTTTGTAGLSVTLFAAAYALGAPVLAALTSTRRPRTVLTAALLALAAANVLCAAAGTVAVFMAGRILAALAACAVTPSAGVLAARTAGPDHRGRALALVVSGLTVATAVGVPLGSLVARSASWRGVLLGVAAVAAAAALTIRTTAPDPDPAGRQRLAQRLAPLGDRRVLGILALTAIGMTAAYIPYAYTADLLPAGTGGGFRPALVLGCYGVGAVAGSLGSGYLTDRLDPGATLTLAYTAMAAAFLVLAARPSLAVAAVAALVWGGASWMQTPPQQHRLLASARPEHAAVAIGTNASALYAGVALGNTVGAALLGSGGRVLCLTASGAALAAFLRNLAVGRRRPAGRGGAAW